ncbi:MAG: hypothetical protein JEZ04_01535 [Spirochaetales bacterium]|nr:hypothetical protein [Spirochaetales bacterium]
MIILYTICGAALIASLIADRKKTLKALKVAFKKFIKIAPAFSIMLILVSVFLHIVTDEMIIKYLGDANSARGIGIAAFFGSITMMPGFVAFPLCGILAGKGVPYSVIASFSTTLMLVGVISFPIEQKYLGMKAGLLRNAVCLVMALTISLIIGFFYGDFTS